MHQWMSDLNINVLTIANIAFVLYIVYKQSYFFLAFVAGFIWNIIINSTIKIWLKDPRPSPIYSDNPVEKYGMPSGHTQTMIFCTIFLYLLNKSPYLVLVSAAFSIIIMFQRYYTKAHTIKQIIGGAALGVVNAWLFFWGTKKYIQNNL